jgi:hypothetical protein
MTRLELLSWHEPTLDCQLPVALTALPQLPTDFLLGAWARKHPVFGGLFSRPLLADFCLTNVV